MNQLLISFSRFSRRDQTLLLLGGVVIVFWLIWMILLSPLQHKRDRLLANNIASTLSFGRVQLLVRQVQNLTQQSAQAGSGGENLSGLINTSLSESGLAMNSLTPNPNGDVQVRIDKASSEALMQWLYELENKHHLVIRDLSIFASKDPGQVAVTVRLMKP